MLLILMCCCLPELDQERDFLRRSWDSPGWEWPAWDQCDCYHCHDFATEDEFDSEAEFDSEDEDMYDEM